MVSTWKIVLAVSLVCVLTVVVLTYALLTFYFRIGNFAVVKTVGVEVYWDSNATQPVTSIDWGMVEPGDSVNRTVFVVNPGNVPIVLDMRTENWSPENASNYIFMSWNYTGQAINLDEKVPVMLTLTVVQNVTGITSFSFDIVIVATESK